MHKLNRTLLVFLAAFAGAASLSYGRITQDQQASLKELEAKLQLQYAAIERQIADPPSPQAFPLDWRLRLREWQDELARRFGQAAATVEQIIKLNPPHQDLWQERRETLLLYSQPISSPESRTVFGSGEVEKSARVLEAPVAAYPDQARLVKANGEVRLRLVLAADDKVKYVFPIKSSPHGLTEAAMEAARLIKFEPAIRNGRPVSQFATFVYEFKQGRALPPYIPTTVF
jgi:TonB family protein